MLVAAIASSGCDAVLRFETVFYHPDAPIDVPVDVPRMPDAPVTCPPSYLLDSTTLTQYRMVPTQVMFPAALADCAKDEVGLTITGHTHLVVLSSAEEEMLLYARNSDTWIGLTDHADGMTWRWVTAEHSLDPSPADVSLWAPGEPNNPMVEDCARFNGASDNLNNVQCENSSEMHSYFCECDAYPYDPSVY